MSTKRNISLLHVEDSIDDAELVVHELRKAFDVQHKIVASGPELLSALEHKWDLVLSDFSMPGFSGLEALTIIHEKAPELPFVFVSGTIGEERAANAIKSGATDYVSKNNLKRLIPVVERVLKDAAIQVSLNETKKNLEKSQRLYKLLAENASDIVAIYGSNGLLTYVSPAVKNLYEFETTELLNTAGTDQMESRDAVIFQNNIRLALTGEQKTFQQSYHMQARIGQLLWLETRGKGVYDADAKANCVLTITRNITEERKKTEQIQDLVNMLDHAQDAIFVRDLDFNILYWNKGAERMYGWKQEELSQSAIRNSLYVQSEQFDEMQKQLWSHGETVGEVTQKTQSGETLTVNVRLTLVRDNEGKPKSVLGIVTNISERKKLEEQFLRAQRLDSIGTLASGIAHDLNNALTPVLLAVVLLKMEKLSDDQLELIETIEKGAQRGADMVKQVLSFARGEEGDQHPIQLSGIIMDIIKIARDTFPKSIKIEMNVAADLWQIKADATQIDQVLLNFAVNARDAMPDGGTLTLDAENRVIDSQYAKLSKNLAAGNHVVIRIEDTGIGMPADVLDKIFEPFFTTKEHGKGTGLGLSTSLAIIKGHGGTVHAYSEPNKGTKFTIYIPALMDAETLHKTNDVKEMPRGHGELILVVDDEKAVREITKQTLAAYGYEVITAADGAEGVAAFAGVKDKISLILTDMMMPTLDGPGMIQVIRKMHSTIPIIAASGLEANGKAAALKKENVRYFLRKPYSAENLLRTIRQALHDEN